VFTWKKNKDNYTGKVTIYNQNIVFSDEYQNGALTVNGIARKKNPQKKLQEKQMDVQLGG
jgi:hypothetical protein